MSRRILYALIVLVLAGLLGWFVLSTNAPSSPHAVKLGLDLAGGTELIYNADTSKITGDKTGALQSLRDVIDRRVNLFGVAEPLVQLEYAGGVSGQTQDRLLVDLPGVTNVQAMQSRVQMHLRPHQQLKPSYQQGLRAHILKVRNSNLAQEVAAQFLAHHL
jgi:preprotein translocase subunit SecD